MRALLYTSDPYEPSGVIGLFETAEQKEQILAAYREHLLKEWPSLYAGKPERLDHEIRSLYELEIPIGVFGVYYFPMEKEDV